MNMFAFFRRSKNYGKKTKFLIIFVLAIVIMFSFFSLNKPKSILPADRFSFMPPAEQQEFINDVNEYFKEKNSYAVDLTVGAVNGPEGMQFGLDNLAQNYHYAVKYDNVSDEQKGKIVSDHFNRLLESEKESKELLKDVNIFNKVKNRLAIRLSPQNLDTSILKNMVYKEDIEGTYSVLVLDLPSIAHYITPENVNKWQVSEEKVFDIALNNTYKLSKVNLEKIELNENDSIWQLGGEDIYAATNVFNLSNYKQVNGKYGSLVIIPHRQAIGIYPINDKNVLEAMNTVPVIASGMYAEGPGSITANMYWYYQGKFINIPYELDLEKNKFSVSPPNEFVDILNKLAEEKK